MLILHPHGRWRRTIVLCSSWVCRTAILRNILRGSRVCSAQLQNMGRAIAHEVSRWLPTAAARVRTLVWSSGIYGGQSGAGAGFLRVLQFPLPIGQKWLMCRVDPVWTPPHTMRIKKNLKIILSLTVLFRLNRNNTWLTNFIFKLQVKHIRPK
jgi:hypothetical protein